MPPRYPTNPNRVTLDLDPITFDALTEAAKAGKVDRQRLAYQLLQDGLGIGMTVAPAAPEPALIEDDDTLVAFNRGLAAIRRTRSR